MDPELCRLFSLEGRTALVTGASSGLGVAFARGLARAGANVVVTARRQEMIDQTADLVRSFGVRSTAIAGDITDEAQIEGIFSARSTSTGAWISSRTTPATPTAPASATIRARSSACVPSSSSTCWRPSTAAGSPPRR
jgi:NAD(P)-dependent dehydrogenase (short-subunit alcohol dehydrogenase family)